MNHFTTRIGPPPTRGKDWQLDNPTTLPPRRRGPNFFHILFLQLDMVVMQEKAGVKR